MDKQKRKDLVNEYMNERTVMGIYCYKCLETGKSYIGSTQNMKAMLNGGTFRLNAGNHKNKNLQADWNKYGDKFFLVETLEKLEYDKEDEMKTDYSIELEILLEQWSKKLGDCEIINSNF